MADEPQGPVIDSMKQMLDEHEHSRLSEARESYNKIVNRLWAGNAGGAVTTLTALRQISHVFYIFPLFIFILGLIFLAYDALIDINFRLKELRSIETAQKQGGTILSIQSQYFSRPSDQARLTWVDLAAGAAFFFGINSRVNCTYDSVKK